MKRAALCGFGNHRLPAVATSAVCPPTVPRLRSVQANTCHRFRI